MVIDRNKLSQDLGEASTVEVQPNGFGFGLDDLVASIVDPVTLRTDLSRKIRDGVDAMKRLQDQFQRSQRPDSERISRLSRVDVFALLPDGATQSAKTSYGFRYEIVTAAGETTAGGTGVISV